MRDDDSDVAQPPTSAESPADAAPPESADPNLDTGDETPAALHRRIEELTTDIGAVLHANTSTLFMAHSAIDVALRALGPNPFADEIPTVEDIDRVLADPTQQAARAIEKLLAIAAEPNREPRLDEAITEELTDSAHTLADYIVQIPIEESRASALRSIACRIQDLLEELPPKTLPKSVLRQVRQAAGEIERNTALAALLQSRAAIMQMDYTIRSFREFVTADLRPREPTKTLLVAGLLETAHRQLVDYAQTSNVTIRRENHARGAEVVGVKRELVRALGNILHNAVKYSWRRDKATPAWVVVNVKRRDTHILIEFENWGVPISPHELKTGMVFELGYRGKWSVDRGRLGTGIGLTDAHDIIAKHRGSLTIESRPARPWGPDDPDSEEYYRQPFLTTVTVSLPESI